MFVTLREIEPFNVEPVSNEDAALFMRHLTGNETFEFDGDQEPKSMMINELKFNLPRHSYASGYLLNVNIEMFEQAGKFLTMEAVYENHIIGKIYIEYGSNIQGVNLNAERLSLNFNNLNQRVDE